MVHKERENHNFRVNRERGCTKDDILFFIATHILKELMDKNRRYIYYTYICCSRCVDCFKITHTHKI